MTESRHQIAQRIAQLGGNRNSPEWLTVALLDEIAATLAAVAADIARVSRAVDRAVARGTDPPQAREFLRRPPRS
jgi:hypothetical protein